MDTKDNYTIVRQLFEKEIKDTELDRPRPECMSARVDNKEDIRNYKTEIKRNGRNYDIYESTINVDGETWMMACCYGEFRNSVINQFLCLFYYHIGWVSEGRRAFFDALKEARFFLATLVFIFVPYLMNYVYLISGMIDLDLFVFETYSEIGFFISILAGLFYWPLGIITGYGCLYAMLI